MIEFEEDNLNFELDDLANKFIALPLNQKC
jgi:hypothetical protein